MCGGWITKSGGMFGLLRHWEARLCETDRKFRLKWTKRRWSAPGVATRRWVRGALCLPNPAPKRASRQHLPNRQPSRGADDGRAASRLLTGQAFRMGVCFGLGPAVQKRKKAPACPPGPVKRSSVRRSIVVFVLFLFLLFARRFFAGLLIDNFHRQADLATVVKAQKLDPDLLTFLQNV